MSGDNNLRGNTDSETEHLPQNRLLPSQQDRTIDTNHTATECKDYSKVLCRTISSSVCNTTLGGKSFAEHCPMSCKVCTPNNSCVDEDVFLCATLTSRNQCNGTIYEKPISEHCQNFCGTCDTFRSNNKRTRSAESIPIYINETEQSQEIYLAALIGMTCFVFFTLMSSWIIFMKRKSIKKIPDLEEEEYETDENLKPQLNDTPIINDCEKKYIDDMMISHQRKTGVNIGPNIELLCSIPSEESILGQNLEFDDVDVIDRIDTTILSNSSDATFNTENLSSSTDGSLFSVSISSGSMRSFLSAGSKISIDAGDGPYWDEKVLFCLSGLS